MKHNLKYKNDFGKVMTPKRERSAKHVRSCSGSDIAPKYRRSAIIETSSNIVILDSMTNLENKKPNQKLTITNPCSEIPICWSSGRFQKADPKPGEFNIQPKEETFSEVMQALMSASKKSDLDVMIRMMEQARGSIDYWITELKDANLEPYATEIIVNMDGGKQDKMHFRFNREGKFYSMYSEQSTKPPEPTFETAKLPPWICTPQPIHNEPANGWPVRSGKTWAIGSGQVGSGGRLYPYQSEWIKELLSQPLASKGASMVASFK